MTRLSISIQILAVTAMAVAGCAASGEQYASTDCKVALHQPGTQYGKASSDVSEADRLEARAKLSAMEMRGGFRDSTGRWTNKVDEALYDCQIAESKQQK